MGAPGTPGYVRRLRQRDLHNDTLKIVDNEVKTNLWREGLLYLDKSSGYMLHLALTV